MGFLEERKAFFNTIEMTKARYLYKENLVTLFLEFMKNEYDRDRNYYLNRYKKDANNYDDFNDYIFSHELGLVKDLRAEYELMEKKAKKNIEKYKNNVKFFDDKIKSMQMKIDGFKTNYHREKCIYVKKINEELLTQAKEERKKENIFREALNKCIQPLINNQISRDYFNDRYKFYNPEQYLDYNWKLMINFGHLSPREYQLITVKKDNNFNAYMNDYHQCINRYDILSELKNIVGNNYYLKDRIEIIEEAVELFKNNKYYAFVYLMVPQVEGIFDVYKKVYGLNVEQNVNGLGEKLNLIHAKCHFIGYIYYAFDFPQIRNEIAHGNIINISDEIAYDTLMDIYYLCSEINLESTPYKKMIEKFGEFSACTSEITYLESVIDCFRGICKEDNLNWFSKCLDGSYSDLLKWYGLTSEFNKMIECIQSQKCLMLINGSEDAEISEEIEFNGKNMSVHRIDSKPKEYEELIEILKQYVELPKTWLSSYEKKIDDIDKKVDEYNAKLEQFITNMDSKITD